MSTTKKIKSLKVVRPGSNPDVDTDFNTAAREHTIEHVRELYGRDNVASIGIFATLKAKGAFKTLCTIYEVPFAQANKVTELIPEGIEGVDVTIDDIYNPASERYNDAVEFRNATAGDEWKEIIEGARAIEGRYKTTGVHACGIVISSQKLLNTIPLQVRQNDGLMVTQWTYPELESLGLIKMDFLGLDTVDLIQASVENLKKSGLELSMTELINGPMDDKKTFEMLGRGETIGLFQLASDGVQKLIKSIKPTGVEDIIATTALFRPGPMGMQSHTRYADRKNGREPVTYVHEAFKGSALETILGKTYGLIVYQEQILQLASQVAGMTLQEGDDLRKAMGKKIMAKMVKMKPIFMEGGMRNGHPEEAMELLWDTCVEFAKYGFNRAHSVAYGINAYQVAYLKANHPVEFMAALISQNIGRKDKISVILREARRMGLKIGSIDVNTSEVKVAPDFKGLSGFDIVYGISGAMAVSEQTGALIVAEREKAGDFKSVQDFVTRCYARGVTNRKIYENIAKAGGFDSFDVSRRGVVENLQGLLEAAKTKGSKGADLFDMFGGAATIEASSIDLKGWEEYPHVERLRMEAEVIGMYLTDHPISKVGPGLSKARNATVESLMKSPTMTTVKLVGSLTEITKKVMRKGGRSITVSLDDGTGVIEAGVARDIVKGIDKTLAQESLRKLYEAGENTVPDELANVALSEEFKAIEDLEKYSVYSVELTFRPPRGEGAYQAKIGAIEKVHLSDDGSLPIRMRILYDDFTKEKAELLARKLPKAVGTRNPGTYSIILALAPRSEAAADENALYEAAIQEMEAPRKAKEASAAKNETANLWGDQKAAQKKGKPVNENARVWPPEYTSVDSESKPGVRSKLTEERVRRLTYVDTGCKADKSKKTELDIEKYLGVESYDFGVFDSSVLED